MKNKHAGSASDDDYAPGKPKKAKKSPKKKAQYAKKMVPCPDCDLEFEKTELAKHIKVVHDGIPDMFTCRMCDVAFELRADYQSHMASYDHNLKAKEITLAKALKAKKAEFMKKTQMSAGISFLPRYV